MRIIYIKLINFVGINAAMGLKEIEFSFEKIDKPIIQIYGKNRCGKTVLIQQLHPFSSINLNGDERSDLSLIIPKEVGVKNIVYEVDGNVYNITHTYQPNRIGHSVSSSILENGKELNPSGGVTIFNNIIEKVLGVNKYVFQFIINGTQLTSFGSMSATQRKNLLNKALGIDIYDKIHKMATDDYRYTNKLITSLTNAKEFIISTYGSYENLCKLLEENKKECSNLEEDIQRTKSRMDSLSGQISVIRGQNIETELITVNNSITAYKTVTMELGSYDDGLYDKLVSEQINLNNNLNNLKSERLLLRKDLDILYGKKSDINNVLMTSKRTLSDHDNMINMRNELINKIDSIQIEISVSSSSSYLQSTISLAQAVNGICKEIVTCLNDNHLKMFTDMVSNGIDVASFLIHEGGILMDSEKEKNVISNIRHMISLIHGEYVDVSKCGYPDCLYWNTYNAIENLFKSYQSASKSQFTQYDIDQIDHAYKNVQTIKRLINTEFSDEVKDLFDIKMIMSNLNNKKYGVDVDYIKQLMEEAAKIEMRNKYISQLTDINKSIETMEKTILPINDMDSAISELDKQISNLKIKDSNIEIEIRKINELISTNDRHRLMISQVRHLNISELETRYNKLTQLSQQLSSAETEYNYLSYEYNNKSSQLKILLNHVKDLSDAFNQYTNTVNEIEKYKSDDNKYRIISEATSSTKGKPVLAIKDTVENALMMTNRLLDIMYAGELELLDPSIDETTFTLPFRCGSNTSKDIRYGSQSESTLLSLALELSLTSTLTKYNIPLIDEIDAYLDSFMHDSFLLMIQETMSVLKMEQLFMISHSITPGSYDHIIHTIDLTK